MPSTVDKSTSESAAYRRFLKPHVFKILHAIGLDVSYQRAVGDYLYYRQGDREVDVLDLVGGFGSCLFGHNHPEVIRAVRKAIDENRPLQAQASVRQLAGMLAQRLSEIVGDSTGREFVVTLANTGTEAVEAAIKHAELERGRRIDEIIERSRRDTVQLHLRLREQTARVSDEFLNDAAQRFDLPEDTPLSSLLSHITRHNLSLREQRPIFLAVEEAFHGKTTGSLSLTYNREFRHPWQRTGLQVSFLPFDGTVAIQRQVERARQSYLSLDINDEGEVNLIERSFCHIAACISEPIQGEGGLREVPTSLLRAMRNAADFEGFPLIIDEVQSGMGRTGTFLASSTTDVVADYYVLAKSLGGGVAKLSALLVDRQRYIDEFGFMHTSTFAEDDLSSAAGLTALDLLLRDDQALMRDCQEKGQYLIGRIRQLCQRYPDQVRDVRGRGLMIGVQLAPQDHVAGLIGVLSDQKLLGYVICGCLLREQQIRVMPTLSAPDTIRIEPSAYISRDNLDRFCEALEEMVQAIRERDSLRLAGFLAGANSAQSVRRTTTSSAPNKQATRSGSMQRRVALLGHFLEPGDLRHWDPTLSPLSDDQCQQLFDKTADVLEPFVVHEQVVRSSKGAVGVTVIGMAFTADQAIAAYHAGTHDWAVESIQKAVDLAKRMGCSVAGLAGYTSIVTDNCEALIEDQLVLTSGNSLAAAAGLEALNKVAQQRGITEQRLGIVGGAGNIGSVLSEVASDRIGQLLLVGRPGARRRLNELSAKIYARAYRHLVHSDQAKGVAAAIGQTRTVRNLRARSHGAGEGLGEQIRLDLEEELGEHTPVRVADDLSTLTACNLIISATNSPRPVIAPSHLADGPVVISDVAAPGDVDQTVTAECPNATVIKGGIVRLPFDQQFGIPGMRLADGRLYACMAETILLGLAGIGHHFSYGPLTADRVEAVLELAKRHAFVIEARGPEFI